MEKIPKFDKRKASNKAVGPGKNTKLINVELTFIQKYRVSTCYTKRRQTPSEVLFE